MNKGIIIVGASGHGKVIADIARKNGYKEIFFLDDNTDIKCCGKYSVLGTSKDSVKYPNYDFVIGIGNAQIRQKIQEQMEQWKLNIVSLIHPTAVVGEDVTIKAGTVVMAGSVVNPATIIGKGCIVNTCSSIDHDCVIEDYVHVSVGTHISGTVNVGCRTWIGAGTVVRNNINICADCTIGAGAVVVKNISESGTYIGVPARKNR